MGCQVCGRNRKVEGYIQPKALESPPYGANDMMVYQAGTTRRLTASDWNSDRHKLLLFIPQTNTPVCGSELGALQKWLPAFSDLDCDVYGVTTDPPHLVKDWFDNEPQLQGSDYPVISSYILPSRLDLLHGGRAKRASVFITKEGDVVKMEHFLKVGRSLSELHRTLYAYTTGSYCGEGWKSPEDGFLSVDKKD